MISFAYIAFQSFYLTLTQWANGDLFGGLKYPYLQIYPKRLLDIPGGTRIVENGYNTLAFQEKLVRSYRNLLNK